jgi:hypothetical protein
MLTALVENVVDKQVRIQPEAARNLARDKVRKKAAAGAAPDGVRTNAN